MSQADDNMTENATHDESLVAYLDGELDATERARVEQRLHEDEKYRQRLEELQRSWELLDLLPSPKLSESFCNTTVEMAVVIADERMRADQSWLLRRRWLLGLAGTVACVTSALASFRVACNSSAMTSCSSPIASINAAGTRSKLSSQSTYRYISSRLVPL